MMPTPKVSVVITSYNHGRFISEAIQSVLNQTFQNFEIVVVDDHSTDDTLDVIRSFEDNRIHLITSEVNLGVSITTNQGIGHAKGQYIALLASDDACLPDRLDAQVDFLDQNPHIAAVFGLPELMDEQGNSLGGSDTASKALRLPDLSAETVLAEFFFECNFLWAPSAMLRRDAVHSIGPFDARLTNLQDFDYWVRLLLSSHNLYVLPQPLIRYRLLDDQRNLSAPRRDTILRHHFEYAMILRHYRLLNSTRFEAIFSSPLKRHGISSGSLMRRLVDLALSAGSFSHRWFALETLYEYATEREDFLRLRDLAGQIDAFGSWLIPHQERRLASLEHTESTHWRRSDPVFTEIDLQSMQLLLYERILAGIPSDSGKFSRIRAKISTSGSREDSSLPSEFNALRYSTRHPDLFEAEDDPFLHYLTHGRQERRSWRAPVELLCLSDTLKRQSLLLDKYEGILIDNVDISRFQRILAKIQASPYTCDADLPAGFNPIRYCCGYTDLFEAEVDPFAHYLLHGKDEGRSWS